MKIFPLKSFRLINGQQWQSVAERISELENQQQHQRRVHDQSKQIFTYLDPSKTNRVPSLTLKAFQKNAVQSYFERQQQHQQSLRISKTKSNTENDEIVKLRNGDLEKKMYMNHSFNFPSPDISSQRLSLPTWPSDVSVMISDQHNATMIGQNKFESFSNDSNDKNNQPTSLPFTSICDVKEEISKSFRTSISQNETLSDTSSNLVRKETPPPLPRKSCILRRLVNNFSKFF